MFEILKASKYYGHPTPGWVLLVNGQPYHFADKRDIPAEYLPTK